MTKRKDNENQKEENNSEMNEDDINFSDPEGYEDDISDSELLPDLLKIKPREVCGVENIIVVDGVPQIGSDRLEKLQFVLRKTFSKFGNIVNEYYPVNENGVTKGFIFLEFGNHSSAVDAAKNANGLKLDKNHTFIVNLFSEFDKYENVSYNWEPPEPQPYKELGNLQYYVQEPDCYDQYSIIQDGGDKVSIYLNSFPEPQLLEEKIRWTETYIRWSPLGTYLATFHDKGVALWGGEHFKQLMKFTHPGAQFLDFSNCEKYLVTFSPVSDTKYAVEDPQSVIVWEIRTQKKKRTFSVDKTPIWPILKWSYDDKYFAKLGIDMISVYETPSFGLLDKKSIKIHGVKDYSWSPAANILAYWVPEDKDIPARVTLLEMPMRKEIRIKNLFNFADCKMHWQRSGHYLCVKVDRYTKSRKGENDELKYSEKQIPVDNIEIKENIHAFAWEPVGSKFAVIHGDSPNICVSFFDVKSGQKPVLLKRFDKEACNHLFWNPQGQFIVLAGLRSMNGTLKFIDTSDFTIMGNSEHFMATDIEWDPTGRYVVTGISYWSHKMDTGYWLWTFQGKVLQRHNLRKFCQLLWRPRPPGLLTSVQIKEIKKNLKEKYSAQFELKDKMRQSRESKELLERRQQLLKEFEEFRNRKREQYLRHEKQRMQLRNLMEADLNNDDQENETIEILIKEIVTEI